MHVQAASPSWEAPGGRIRELDGWRAISILLVLLDHTLLFAFPALTEHSRLLTHLAGNPGECGVETFFVISGFVITRLLLKEEQRNGRVSLRGFYVRRVFRILPVFLLMVGVVCLLSRMGLTPVSREGVFQAVFFLKDFTHTNFDWFLGHTWSLAVEEQFYIVFPLLWIAIPRRLRPVFLLSTLGCFLAWAALAQCDIFGNLLDRTAIVGFSCINLGALLALYEVKVRAALMRMPSFVPAIFAVFLILRPLPNTHLGRVVYYPLVPFGIGLVLMYTVSRPGWAASLLKTRLLQWIGLISYSAYLWQQLFDAHPSFYGSPRVAAIFHLALPGVFLVAALCYYGVERPTSNLGRRLSKKLNARWNRAAEDIRAARQLAPNDLASE